MSIISLTGDHLVPVSGPHAVTVVSGSAVNYSTDRTYTVHGTIEREETVTIEQPVWLWSPSLSEVRVEPAKQHTLNDLMGRIADVEQRPNPGDELAKFIAPEPKPRWRAMVLPSACAACAACGPVALALTILH